MKRNHGYFILWGKSGRVRSLCRASGEADFVFLLFSGCRVLVGDPIPPWPPPPVERSSSEMRIHFQCWPPAKGPLPEVRSFSDFRVKTKSTGKGKKRPQTSVNQRLRFFISELSNNETGVSTHSPVIQRNSDVFWKSMLDSVLVLIGAKFKII